MYAYDTVLTLYWNLESTHFIAWCHITAVHYTNVSYHKVVCTKIILWMFDVIFSLIQILFIYYSTKEAQSYARWKHLRSIGFITVDGACRVSWEENIPIPYSTGSSTFIHFCYFSDSLDFVSGWLLFLLMSILFHFFLMYTWKLLWGNPLRSYSVCLLSCDSSPTCQKCWSVSCISLNCGWWFWLPLDYELSL